MNSIPKIYEDSIITMLDDTEHSQVIMYTCSRGAIALRYDDNFFNFSDVIDAYEELMEDIRYIYTDEEIAESKEQFYNFHKEQLERINQE